MLSTQARGITMLIKLTKVANIEWIFGVTKRENELLRQ